MLLNELEAEKRSQSFPGSGSLLPTDILIFKLAVTVAKNAKHT
jgi:hypothetical protein